MDRRYPFIRRRVRRARLQQRVAAALMLGIAGSTLGFALMGEPDPVAAGITPAPTLLALASAPVQAVPGKVAPRRIYPYSIVPGGAATRTELARVIRTDKVVAAHYASFDVDKARPVTVTRARAVHVSYRKGDKVYWTAKKIMLAEGETLLSDGSNEMRARCANRISDLAQFPVEADGPGAEVLDTVFEEGVEAEFAFAPVGGAGPHEEAYVERGNVSGMQRTLDGDMGDMGNMPHDRSFWRVPVDPPPYPATTAPVFVAAPTAATLPAGTPEAPAGLIGGTGSPLPPGAQLPPGGQPPATGGGSDVVDPVPRDAGAKPGPFIPEPRFDPPAPTPRKVEVTPAVGEVLEPPAPLLFITALAGIAFSRRRSRATREAPATPP